MDPELRRRAQGNVHTDDPLRDVTRKERRTLLGVSTASILIAKTGLVPSEIQNLGIKFTPTEQSVLLLGLAAVVVYFLIVFIVYAVTDWLAVMWDFHAVRLEFDHQARLEQISHPERRAARTVVGALEPPAATFKYRRLTSVMGHMRRFLDFALPIIVAVFALVSIASAVREAPPRSSQVDQSI